MSKEKNQPVESVRVGSVKIAIWKNEGQKGVYFSASPPEITYKKDGVYHRAKSLNGFNLVHLAKASLLADSALARLRFEAKQAGQAEEPQEEMTDEIQY